MARFVTKISPALVLPDEGGALKSGQEEGGENALTLNHTALVIAAGLAGHG
jgi:hypothetical protein